jgi:hypothetical protein
LGETGRVLLAFKGGEINHEEHEGHKEFAVAASLVATSALWRCRQNMQA